MCPACRAHTERGLELHSLVIEVRSSATDTELIDGILRCRGCARAYPVVDGIPIVLRDLSHVELAAPPPPEVSAAIAAAGPDSAPVAQSLAQLSSYLDASWGDRAGPPPDGPGAGFGFGPLAEKLRDRPRVALCLELGCGVGRGVLELAAGAGLVVGLDGNFAMLRAAREILVRGELLYARRMAGRSYTVARVRSEPVQNVELVCGDALDPPFAPGAFDRVAALNLLDNVRSPRALLHHVAQLSAGEVLLSAPYAWRDGIVDDGERLGGLNPAAAVRDELRALGLSIEDDAPRVRWTLRHDSRAATAYEVHYLRAARR